MATLNGLYIFVESEEFDYGVEITEHVVEQGVNISDHVKPKGTTLSLTGEIVGTNAASTLAKLKQMQQNGTVCNYAGRASLSNCLISELHPGYAVDIWGGCSFTMTLKEIRTAGTSYKKPAAKSQATTKTGTQQVKKQSKAQTVTHTVKKGDTVWGLVASSKAPYKKYGMSCDDIMKMNPDAFSRKGDFRTLKVGANLIISDR